MIIEGCEISEEVISQVVKRMQMGTFQKESLVPIVKAYQPEVRLISHQIIERIIDVESSAGRVIEVFPGFWDVPKKSTLERVESEVF